MKNGKRIVALATCLSMATTALTACGGSDEKGVNSAEGRVYYLNFKPEQAEIWENLADSYTDETGVEVTVVTAASGTYEQTLTSEIVKSDAPTMFQVNGPAGLRTWKDYCYDLSNTQLYNQVKSDDFVLKEDGEVLGIAYVIETYGIIYNKTLLNEYIAMEGAVISSIDEINNFDTLKAVADDIQSKKDELGIEGAFASAGMDSSSDWRFKTHLANLPIYYEYKDKGITSASEMQGTYLENYKNVWDMYISDSTCDPRLLSSKTADEATAEFATGKAVFYQNGTWVYNDITAHGLTDDEIGIMPIYIGAPGEENQGLCTGSENYWCVNKEASDKDIEATIAFMEWCITSDEGRDAMANKMGFVTPFESFDEDEYTAKNPLVEQAKRYIDEGRESVGWYFSTIPSDNWKSQVGSALLEYAQGTGDWSRVEEAFISGWKTEYDATR